MPATWWRHSLICSSLALTLLCGAPTVIGAEHRRVGGQTRRRSRRTVAPILQRHVKTVIVQALSRRCLS